MLGWARHGRGPPGSIRRGAVERLSPGFGPWMADADLEAWLRGPTPGIPALLQPVAHALLQAREDVGRITGGFPGDLLWTRPSGVASVGFHLQHLTGVLDRLFTYARGEQLSEAQREALGREGRPGEPPPRLDQLVEAFHRQVDLALDELRAASEARLTEPREVGRARLPSTVLGLYAHAAEHTQRHVGQLLVTVRVQHPRSEA
jgi:uncharacterized damage-inducible protein DinB